jgi:hypothetical protein
LKISIITSNATHEIRFFEFIAPAGWTITSFFQVVEKPDIGIGCVDSFNEALELVGYTAGDQKAYIHAAYLQAIGVAEIDYADS